MGAKPPRFLIQILGILLTKISQKFKILRGDRKSDRNGPKLRSGLNPYSVRTYKKVTVRVTVNQKITVRVKLLIYIVVIKIVTVFLIFLKYYIYIYILPYIPLILRWKIYSENF